MTLTAPRIDRSLVRRTVAGLRPFRPAGFRVDVETIGDRLLVHNYGHGGSGVTLAPGTALRAATLAGRRSPSTAAVIGAGAAGLCTARALQDHGWRVAVHAAGRSPDTTSDIAGALWGAFSLVDPEYRTPELAADLAAVARASHAWVSALPPARYGIREIALYLVGDAPALSWEMAVTPELFPVEPVPRRAHPFAASGVLRTRGLMIEPARFLRALAEDVVAAGGSILARQFASRDDVLAVDADLIVNCAGLGAGPLFGDTTLEPIKGTLALLASQPGVDYGVISMDDDAYILPREQALVVGGSRLRGDATLDVSDAEIDAILARARQLFR